LKAIVPILVLAIWSVCTAHCAIENLNGSTELPCCNESGGQSDQVPNAPGQCVCGVIQSGGYVSQEKVLSIPLPLDDLCLFEVSPADIDLPTNAARIQPALATPEVVRPWQFFFRAALPARAPSCLS